MTMKELFEKARSARVEDRWPIALALLQLIVKEQEDVREAVTKRVDGYGQLHDAVTAKLDNHVTTTGEGHAGLMQRIAALEKRLNDQGK
jgi:hypothetical protein